MRGVYWLALVLLLPASARAEEAREPGTGFGAAGPVTNRINLRAGAASTDTVGRPTICLDVAIIRGFGVEACGTGAGILHHEPGTEMAHFRAHYTARAWNLARGQLRLRGVVGFAELQQGDDAGGFQFGEPDPVQQSVAGGEIAASAQWLVPAWSGLDVVANLTTGLAYLRGAPDLAVPQSATQPFVSFELGIGW